MPCFKEIMQKVYITKNYKMYVTGQTYLVSNNEAHSIIDGGCGCLNNYLNKMIGANVHNKKQGRKLFK
jgi:hypothetical protein